MSAKTDPLRRRPGQQNRRRTARGNVLPLGRVEALPGADHRPDKLCRGVGLQSGGAAVRAGDSVAGVQER